MLQMLVSEMKFLKQVLHLIEVAFKTGWISVIKINTEIM